MRTQGEEREEERRELRGMQKTALPDGGLVELQGFGRGGRVTGAGG